MLNRDEFEKWIKASHIMFEIFEGRYDACPLARRWAQDWLCSQRFKVREQDIERLRALINNFNYEVFATREVLKERISGQVVNLINEQLAVGEHDNVGFAIAPFLFTWNFQRFKKYFSKKKDFNLGHYFHNLGDFLKSQSGHLQAFNQKKLLDEEPEVKAVKNIFKSLNEELRKLGIGNNEPVGVVKLLHVFAPYYFPLIDNDIGEVVGLLPSGRSFAAKLNCDNYLQWMDSLKRWLRNYCEVIKRVENAYGVSILKLADEGLYMMSTVKQHNRVPRLGIKV